MGRGGCVGTFIEIQEKKEVVKISALSSNLKIPLPISSDKVSRTNVIEILNAIDANAVSKDRVLSDVPEEAKFTDTVYIHPGEGTNPHGTTKEDLELENVDNVKQMPISGGMLENYGEKLITMAPDSGTVNLNLGNVFKHAPGEDITYEFSNAVSGQAHSFTLIIEQGDPSYVLTFPEIVKWAGAEAPDINTAGKTYLLTFLSVDGGATWMGMFGGEF